ncbi:nicotinamide mononucleotide transporter, partial [Salmonella enterica]|uniref:nicotinamide mononucleotide transporter n=1 Tax=Salmonella enterica TaxID=28901 RepID=UPI003D2CF97B
MACAGSVLGTYWCGKKIIWCWPLWIVASFIWIVVMSIKSDWAAVFMFSCYEVFNVIGWRKWAAERNFEQVQS